jgi:hypothetical protein
MTESIELAGPPSAAPGMSPFERLVAVFVRPAQAWEGLQERPQWWFAMLVMVLVSIGISLFLHERAMLPMMSEAWDRAVADGQMPATQADAMYEFMAGPAGMAITAGQQVVAVPLMLLITALAIWFGAGFALGSGLRFRLALEVAAWSSLITLPAYLITAGLAWGRETMRGVHVGFGALLPAMDEPTRFGVALRAFLDGIGPLSVWYVAVAVLGAAALSGAPRRSVAWVLGSLYVAVLLFLSAMAALFTPGA